MLSKQGVNIATHISCYELFWESKPSYLGRVKHVEAEQVSCELWAWALELGIAKLHVK